MMVCHSVCQVEAAWKLGNWDVLREIVNCQDSSSQSWSMGIGKLLLAAKDKQQTEFNLTMNQLKMVGMLCNYSMS